jgi:hypothetical protein
MSQPRSDGVRPARLWYWVAGAAAAAAIVWLALGLFLGLRALDRQVEEFQRVPIPGQVQVSFAEPGGYTLYFEGSKAADEQVAISQFRLSLTSVGSGEQIPISPYGGSATYNFAGHAGRAVGTFRIAEPGEFLLQATGGPQSVRDDLAVGRSIAPAIVRMLVPTVPGTLILFFGAAGLTAVVAIRRNRAQRSPTTGWERRPATGG